MKSTKTKAAKPLSEAGDGLTGSQVTLSIAYGYTIIINCTDESVSLGTPMLVTVSNPTGKIVTMSQVPDNLPSLPISVDIPRGKADRCSDIWKNLQVVLEDSETEDYSGESEQGSDEEGGHPAEEVLPSDDRKEEELIPNPEL